MKKWVIVLLIIGAVIGLIVLIGFFMSRSYFNNMVEKEVNAETQWAQVENVYERKYKLLPNLVSTAKNYADFEKEVLTQVTEARSQATKIKLTADDLTPENLQKFEAAQEKLSGSFSRLLLTFERYPNLKASDLYKEVQAELSGSENRITVERQRFNTVVGDYNIYIRKFPNNFFAGMYGFEKKALFEASEEAVKNDYDVNEGFK